MSEDKRMSEDYAHMLPPDAEDERSAPGFELVHQRVHEANCGVRRRGFGCSCTPRIVTRRVPVVQRASDEERKSL